MAKKLKKQTSSMSFSLSRWFSKISTTKPSSLIVSIVVLSFTIFLFSGGIYTIVSSPLPAYYTGTSFLFLYPGLGSQFISDSIIAIMLYAIGFIGLLTVYQSTKYAYNPRQAYMMIVIGVTLLLIAYIFLEDSIYIKLGG
jgi:hypothetical protein